MDPPQGHQAKNWVETGSCLSYGMLPTMQPFDQQIQQIRGFFRCAKVGIKNMICINLYACYPLVI